jgi:hypothetical protein
MDNEKLNCDHSKPFPVARDTFFQIPGVRRFLAGDCICNNCNEPVPVFWNNGKPIPAETGK